MTVSAVIVKNNNSRDTCNQHRKTISQGFKASTSGTFYVLQVLKVVASYSRPIPPMTVFTLFHCALVMPLILFYYPALQVVLLHK